MNRFTFAIFCVCILACATAQSTCKVFTCGNINQPEEGDKVCVQNANQEDADDMFHVGGCGEKYCQAFTWADPSAATEATCGNTAPPLTWGVFNPEDNQALDGDKCEKDTHCMRTDKNQATCENNVCKSTLGAGDECDASTECPIGHNCAGDPQVCTALAQSGDECAATTDCDFRLECVRKGDSTETAPTCEPFGKMNNGDKFIRVTATESNADLEAAPVCQSGFSVTIDGVSQCRQGITNNKDPLSTETVGENCPLSVYDDDSLDNFDTAREDTTSSMSMCGFNKDSKAYCVPQPGDSDIMDAQKKFISQAAGLKCHQLTGTPGAGSLCNDFYEWQISDDGWSWFTTTSLVGTPNAQAHANIANNDKCVAESLTVAFWQDHFGDNAFGLSVAAISAAALSFVF